MDEIGDEDDPRKFTDLLRRHISEVDSIVRDIERTMDSRLVHRYMHLFSNILYGGNLKDDLTSVNELSSMNVIKKRLDEWNKNSKKGKKSGDPNGLGDQDNSSGHSQQDTEFEFFEDSEAAPFEKGVNLAPSGSSIRVPVVGDGSVPPPPPIPPPSNLVQKPCICAINFDGISVSDIVGTIWSEMNDLQFKDEESSRLESQLRIIFGRESRSRNFEEKSVANEGVLEANRLKNVEILMFMEELKPFSVDEIVDKILKFDDSIFTPHILERLARLVGRGEEKVYSFLPDSKESEKLLEYEQRILNDPALPRLRLGEQLFLAITKRIPDRFERFEFGSFILKFEQECPSVLDQLKVVSKANHEIRKNEKFKSALRVLLEIVNTLMPRFGLTKGFKISTFCPSIERVTGTAQNIAKSTSKVEPKPLQEDPGVEDEKERKKRSVALKIQNLRKSREKVKESDFWVVHLAEYISIYLNKFEACQGFWESLIIPCQEAMKVDQALLDQESAKWLTSYRTIKTWYDGSSQIKDDPFLAKVKTFLDNDSLLHDTRQRISDTRKETEDLWRWLGERMESEPQHIFNYVHSFCTIFQNQWKTVSNVWNDNKTKVLRGVLQLKAYKKPENGQVPASPTIKKKKKQSSSKKKSRPVQETIARIQSQTLEDASDHLISIAK